MGKRTKLAAWRPAAFLLAAILLMGCLLTGCGSTLQQTAAPGKEPEGGTVAADKNEKETTVPKWVWVTLEGGSGKASVASPAEIRERDGSLFAVICWSSPNYDYMLVDGERYDPVSTEGNAVFEIPLPELTGTLAVQADTTAMSKPHLIDYTLVFQGEALLDEDAEQQTALTEAAQETAPKVTPIAATEAATELTPEAAAPATESPVQLNGMTYQGSMELQYARQYTVDYYDGGRALITIAGTERYLLVPEGGSVPNGLPSDVKVLQQPLQNIYLVSSSAMDMFASCDAMESLGFCALNRGDWYVEEAVDAMENGSLVYAGKYSAPDYELLYAGSCGLAIENMMITHSPEVVEQLELLGIPVIVERSSYEESPQGRMEWIKLWGLLTGHTTEANEAFGRQLESFQTLEGLENTGKTVAFFYVTTNGAVSVRNAGDYIPHLIKQAGGVWLFPELGKDSASATTQIQLEEFYAAAQDADYLIYNSTIIGELDSLQGFVDLCPLFQNLKAVQGGHVYCTEANLYQKTMSLGDFVNDLYHMLRDDGEAMTYLRRLT